MSESAIIATIRGFVVQNPSGRQSGFLIRDDESTLGPAALDSAGVADLIAFIEAEFGVFVSTEEIGEASSLRAIAHFVACNQPFAVG
jgi:acyl carrier protein